MIHLFYGDAAADAFRRFARSPTIIVLREALLSGPAALPSAAFRELRIQYLASAFEADVATCRDDARRFDDAIAGLDDAEELVCWFGRDLFCQIGLMYTLVRLGAAGIENASLVCPSSAGEDVFCFGDIAPAEMNDLLNKRARLEPLQFQQAAIAWHLYSSDAPHSLNAVFDGSIDVGAPFARALEQHASRFPWTADGLGTTERIILTALREGPLPFSELFQRVTKRTRDITWGDGQVLELCRHLQSCTPALLSRFEPSNGSGHLAFDITPEGRAILEGDQLELHRPHHWLGGCELFGRTLWQWDPAARRIVYSGT